MSILPHALRHSLKRTGARLRNALLPASCLLCGVDSGKSLLCPACAADLPALPAARCPQCAEPTTHGERCGACLKDAPHFAATVALWRYDFPADRLVHALKYGHQLAVAKWFGEQLAKRIDADRHDLLIPLPLHPSRLRERGFNQSAEIARNIGKRLGLPVDRSSLIRNRATPPQAELPLAKRQGNVRGAFECRSDLGGRRILLVDDVMTSGSTANECARVLALHGAAEVTVAVAARALKY